MPKITELYCWIVDEGDGDEGIPAVLTEMGWMPLIGADMERIKSLKSEVKMIGNLSGKELVLKKFVLVEKE